MTVVSVRTALILNKRHGLEHVEGDYATLHLKSQYILIMLLQWLVIVMEHLIFDVIDDTMNYMKHEHRQNLTVYLIKLKSTDLHLLNVHYQIHFLLLTQKFVKQTRGGRKGEREQEREGEKGDGTIT